MYTKVFERSVGVLLRYFLEICLEGTEENNENVNQDNTFSEQAKRRHPK
jgi:hypothetical protein